MKYIYFSTFRQIVCALLYHNYTQEGAVQSLRTKTIIYPMYSLVSSFNSAFHMFSIFLLISTIISLWSSLICFLISSSLSNPLSQTLQAYTCSPSNTSSENKSSISYITALWSLQIVSHVLHQDISRNFKEIQDSTTP